MNKTFFLLFSFLFTWPIVTYASLDFELAQVKLQLQKVLELKFSYRGRLVGSYGFMNKVVDPEDVAANREFLKILQDIQHPIALEQYESIYIGTDTLANDVRLSIENKTIVITGKRLSARDVIRNFSGRAEDEALLKHIENERLENFHQRLDKIVSVDFREAFLDIYKTRCLSRAMTKEAFQDHFSISGYQQLPAKEFNLDDVVQYNPEFITRLIELAEIKERATLRFLTPAQDNVVIFFTGRAAEVKMSSQDRSKTFDFSLNLKCDAENVMIRTIAEETVKEVIHLDHELKLIKRIENNQERVVRSPNRNVHTTTIAILDSGLDYNHPSIMNNMAPSDLTQGELELYEEAKICYINKEIISSELNRNKKEILRIIETVEQKALRAQQSLEKHQTELSEQEEEIGALKTSLEALELELQQYQKTVDRLEKDHLISLKPTKMRELREARSEVRRIKGETLRLKYRSESLVNRLTPLTLRKDKSASQFEEVLTEKQRAQQSLSQINKNEQHHFELLDIFHRGVSAWDFHDDNDTPYDFWDGRSSVMSTNYDHGTHVAGIILNGARDELSVFPLRYPKQKLFDIDREKDKKVYQAIELAHKKGIRIVNISMGTFARESKTPDEKMKNDEEARNSWEGFFKSAKDFPDMLFICAAGNDGANTDERGHYPSGFQLENVISVAAVDENGELADFSNYGKISVDFAAPGVNILSSIPGGEEDIKSGTSMATPYVARVAGRIKHINPNLTPIQVKNILGETVRKRTLLKNKTVFGGIVDERKAIFAACLTIKFSERINHPFCS